MNKLKKLIYYILNPKDLFIRLNKLYIFQDKYASLKIHNERFKYFYDLNKFKNGPVKVEIEYAPGVIESVFKVKQEKKKKVKTVKQTSTKKTTKKAVNTNLGRFI